MFLMMKNLSHHHIIEPLDKATLIIEVFPQHCLINLQVLHRTFLDDDDPCEDRDDPKNSADWQQIDQALAELSRHEPRRRHVAAMDVADDADQKRVDDANGEQVWFVRPDQTFHD